MQRSRNKARQRHAVLSPRPPRRARRSTIWPLLFADTDVAVHEVPQSTSKGNLTPLFGLGWRSGREFIIPLVALACYADGSAAEGWTVEAADILLLGRSGRDKWGGHRRGGGRIGPGVNTKWGGLWRRAVDGQSKCRQNCAWLCFACFLVRRAPAGIWGLC